MDAAWELGIDHFDTADAYGGGRSESRDRRLDRSRGVRPTLTTKTYNPMDAGADHGLAPERIARQLESSLERLGVDRVDLYLAHEFDPDVPLAETFGGVRRARGGGPDPRLRRQQLRRRAARRGARRRATGGDPERALAAGARRRGRACCRCAARARSSYLAFSPLAGGLADRQVPPRRAVPGGVADDPAARAVRGARRRRARSIGSSGSTRLARGAANSMAGARARLAAGGRARHPGRRRPRSARAPGAGARGARATADSAQSAPHLDSVFG